MFATTGNGTLEFEGSSTVSVGQNFIIRLYVSDINNTSGIVAMEGNLNFDNRYLEYVNAFPTTEPYEFFINPDNNYKIAGLDTSLNHGITEKTMIMVFVFRAVKTGTTEITLTNPLLTDRQTILNSHVIPKKITINE